jgi:orotate phosphoribosyltransferase
MTVLWLSLQAHHPVSKMPPSKQEFIELCLAHSILSFGEFTLKSGRVSPYFFNAGLFQDGLLLGRLASHYADLLVRVLGREHRFMLYGPAYKGIPLAAACAIRLADEHDIAIPYAFNRKESKDHGEGGNIVGAALSGEVVIVDDVITAGTSIAESMDIIRAAGARPIGVVIALDREERAGDDHRSAVQAVEDRYGIPVHAIIHLSDLADHLSDHPGMQTHAQAVNAYRARYGVVGSSPGTATAM